MNSDKISHTMISSVSWNGNHCLEEFRSCVFSSCGNTWTEAGTYHLICSPKKLKMKIGIVRGCSPSGTDTVVCWRSSETKRTAQRRSLLWQTSGKCGTPWRKIRCRNTAFQNSKLTLKVIECLKDCVIRVFFLPCWTCDILFSIFFLNVCFSFLERVISRMFVRPNSYAHVIWFVMWRVQLFCTNYNNNKKKRLLTWSKNNSFWRDH